MQGIKVVLSTKKEVLLRELKISHQELAAQAVGSRAGENTVLFSLLMAKELIKILLHSIDGKPVVPMQLEKLDDLFSIQEYSQLQQVLQQIMGDAGGGKPQLEIVSFGDK